MGGVLYGYTPPEDNIIVRGPYTNVRYTTGISSYEKQRNAIFVDAIVAQNVGLDLKAFGKKAKRVSKTADTTLKRKSKQYRKGRAKAKEKYKEGKKKYKEYKEKKMKESKDKERALQKACWLGRADEKKCRKRGYLSKRETLGK